MLKITEISERIYDIEILEPKESEDEVLFLDFMDKILRKEAFGLILSVSGDKGFSQDGKRKLSMWFKNNKRDLSSRCIGFARVSSHSTKVSRLKNRTLTLAMPCPYRVFESRDESIEWMSKMKLKK